MSAGMIDEGVFIQRRQIGRWRGSVLKLWIEIAARQQAIRAVRTIAVPAGLHAPEAGAIVDIVRQTEPPDGARNDQQRDANANHQQRSAQILRRVLNQPSGPEHNAAQGAGNAAQRKDANDEGQRGSRKPFAKTVAQWRAAQLHAVRSTASRHGGHVQVGAGQAAAHIAAATGQRYSHVQERSVSKREEHTL